MIEYKNVCKSYGKKEVIKNLNLYIEEGKFVSLIGSSGCGKTTTLKMVNGLIPINSGEILINGESIHSYNPDELRRKIGYVIQSIGLFPNMTVEQNISIVPELLKWDKEDIHDRVIELMDMVNMPYKDYGNKYPSQLSGGQKQRIGVLRALAANPNVILMDEPFGALDPITRDIMQEEVRTLQRKLGKTIIFVTHDMNEALKLSDEIVFMDKGKILQKASPEEILENPANDTVKEFLGLHANVEFSKNEMFVRDVMKHALIGSQDSSLKEVVYIMDEKNYEHMVLTDNKNVYQGVIEINDIEEKGRKGMKASELMIKSPYTVYENDMAKNAFDILSKHKGIYLVVLNKNDEPVGIVTRMSLSKSMANYIWG